MTPTSHGCLQFVTLGMKKHTIKISLWNASKFPECHTQKNWVTSSPAYLRIENLIEPIPTCWNVSHFCAAYLRRHVWFAKHVGLFYSPNNTNGSLWQHVAFAKTTSVPFASNWFWICCKYNLRHTLAAFCKIDQKYRYKTLVVVNIFRLGLMYVY